MESPFSPTKYYRVRSLGASTNSRPRDILEVPQRSRTAGTYRHLAKIMAELGWALFGSAT